MCQSLCQNNIYCTLLQIYSRTFLEFSRALAVFLVSRFEKGLMETQTFKEKKKRQNQIGTKGRRKYCCHLTARKVLHSIPRWGGAVCVGFLPAL